MSEINRADVLIGLARLRGSTETLEDWISQGINLQFIESELDRLLLNTLAVANLLDGFNS